jgi:putative membrane protein
MQPDGPAADTAPARWTVAGLTLAVVAAVAIVLGTSGRTSVSVDGPPALASLNAALNGAAACCLTAGFLAIRARRVRFHRACMVTAFALSSVFLVTYLIHHSRAGSVEYAGVGWLRTVYFAILLPHIVLAAVIVPMALLSIYRGWTGKVAAHRKIARWTLPLWLYVSVSGVLVYGMLYYGH